MKARDEAEGMVTTSISFDRATYRQLGHLAVDEDTTVRELIRRAVEEYLRRHQKGRTTR
jgi:predicted transcriptional regulator